MRDCLELRAAASADDASSRRLLGRLLLDSGEVDAALAHLRRSVELDPGSAAARFDLGRALMAAGDIDSAAEQWRTVADLAPDSEYAVAALERLARLQADSGTPAQTVGYEIREYPGPPGIASINDPLAPPQEEPRPSLPVFLRFETGFLYNSNVALAPTSRQLPPGQRESFQLYAAPEVEWWAVSKGDWVAGPLFSGYFTFNQDRFSGYDLASYAPGVFAEATMDQQPGSPIVRCEYRYNLDLFGGRQFARRHSVLGRMTIPEDSGGATTGYLAVDQTNYTDDGPVPEITSADGTTWAGGISKEFLWNDHWIQRLRTGLDLDRLDSRGTDYAYWGAGFTGQAVIPFGSTVELTIRGGLGMRIFDRYEFEPDRDEWIWRGGCELRKWFTRELSAAAVANYQRFDSDNPLFEADRMVAGILMEYRY